MFIFFHGWLPPTCTLLPCYPSTNCYSHGETHLSPQALSPKAAQNILHDNAERWWFEGWDYPKGGNDDIFRRQPPCLKAETLNMHQGKFTWKEGDFY